MAIGNQHAFGRVLRELRSRRQMSQMALALEAEVSTRHLSFLETGRAAPSREMVLGLGRALDLPLRERNQLLLAAGFAPLYRETPLEAPEMRDVRRALELLLRQHEPFGAVAMNRNLDLVMVNRAFARFAELLGAPLRLAPYEVARPPLVSSLALIFGTPGMWQFVENWPEVAAAMLLRLERDQRHLPSPAVAEVLRAHRHFLKPAGSNEPTPLVVPVIVRLGDLRLSLFSTIATLGTAQDITLAELHIESFHAADEATEAVARALAAAD